ncbi:murein L,D-transpeptidase catalytic domain family protein [Solirubrum puertoriconensis]|uniref:Murein L,D-transpeptidase catalytic domain family protein n=1 Tax=Solirubrum puertoriconensis TaxID=1751427 RepID=A0A9X0L4R2_SOLP1|nr:murein L,D-transpeptidase catalytic domain family protein [Solirubrum puertoriconensis]KUG07732.1 hypothetical protein ASU33_15555 [Solirubrum puertoriconensis]
MKLFRYAVLGLLCALSSWQPIAKAAPPPARTLGTTQAAYMAAFEQHLVRTYAGAKLAQTGLNVQVLRNAMIGYYNLKSRGLAKNSVLTVIDFSRSSRQNRLWVIDLARTRLLYHTLVAHGKNTGADLARTFSNRPGSEMSSLGFYLTGQTYYGKHGLSLKLHGLDPKYNSNAASRAVVVHGADYVQPDFIRQHGRLGRSQGCPALPPQQSASIIKTIKNGSVMYVQGPSSVPYASNWLNLNAALPAFARTQGISPMLGQAGQ